MSGLTKKDRGDIALLDAARDDKGYVELPTVGSSYPVDCYYGERRAVRYRYIIRYDSKRGIYTKMYTRRKGVEIS